MVDEVVTADSLTWGQKISAANKGKVRTEAQKQNMRDAAKKGRELWEKNIIDPVTGKRQGFRLGRKPKEVKN